MLVWWWICRIIFIYFFIYPCFSASIGFHNRIKISASIWEKVFSILAGNLNSGRSYLIITTAHLPTFSRNFNKQYVWRMSYKIWKNILWKRHQKRRMLLQMKNCTPLWQHWEKKGKNFCLHCNFFVFPASSAIVE